MDAGEPLVIVDLRTALDVETAPYRIPGARLIDPEVLRHPTPPSRARAKWSSTARSPAKQPALRVALRAAALGFHDVHPLSGGLEAWREAGFPVEPVDPASSAIGSRGPSA
jgi:rhodanese-related sulfurtransferase